MRREREGWKGGEGKGERGNGMAKEGRESGGKAGLGYLSTGSPGS